MSADVRGVCCCCQLEKYQAYRLIHDTTDALSKPDQFMYELSRVPGYEDRLKAILFKESFDEKVHELKQVSTVDFCQRSAYNIKTAAANISGSSNLMGS